MGGMLRPLDTFEALGGWCSGDTFGALICKAVVFRRSR